MTRNGKIARLNRELRERLNRRLQDGEPGKKLVAWLNSLPEVRAVLDGEFAGRPINEQNLSHWKAHGFQDWVRHQESLQLARTLVEEAGDLEAESDDTSLADRISPTVALALGRLLRELLSGEDLSVKERLSQVLPLAAELSRLRRMDHEQEFLKLKRERWENELETELGRARSAAETAPLTALLLARSLGSMLREDTEKGGELPAEWRMFLATQSEKVGPGSVNPDQTESSRIKPERKGGF